MRYDKNESTLPKTKVHFYNFIDFLKYNALKRKFEMYDTTTISQSIMSQTNECKYSVISCICAIKKDKLIDVDSPFHLVTCKKPKSWFLLEQVNQYILTPLKTTKLNTKIML